MNNFMLNEQVIYDTWVPVIEIFANISSPERLKWLAKYCHYHALHENATLGNTPGMGSVLAPTSSTMYGAGGSIGGNQGTIPNVFYNGTPGSGDKMPILLPLSIQVAANTIAFDLVNVIPMATPAGMLAYMDYVYTDGKLNGAGAGNKPTMVKVNVTAVAGQKFVKGTTYYVRESGVGKPNVLMLSYIGRSRIDGLNIFRVRELTGGDSLSVADIFTGGTTPYRVYTDPNGGVEIVDSASMTGKRASLVKALEDHIPQHSGAGSQDMDDWGDSFAPHEPGLYEGGGNGASNGRYAAPMGRETGENTYYRTMGMQLYSKMVTAQTVQNALTVTTEQIQDFKKNYGLDVMGLGETALVDQLTQHINKHILGRMFALGWTNHCNAYRSEGVDMNLHVGANGYYSQYIGKDDTIEPFPATGNPPNALAAGTNLFENQQTIQRRIMGRMLASGNVIANRGRRGPANFGVLNTKIASAIQDISGFMPAPMNNTVNQKNGSLYPVGSVAGVTVYVDPNMRWNDTRVCIGRKGDDAEPGLKFMPYLMAESVQTIAEGTMSPKIAVKSRYALAEAGQWPETMYLTFDVTRDSSQIDFI